MTISERIFERIQELSMSQKEFSEKTSIRQSTISEWKKKKTNPSADKIMIICKTLDVTPEWLLSGADALSGYRNQIDWYVVGRNTEQGVLITQYNMLDSRRRARLQGFLEAILDEVEKK